MSVRKKKCQHVWPKCVQKVDILNKNSVRKLTKIAKISLGSYPKSVRKSARKVDQKVTQKWSKKWWKSVPKKYPKNHQKMIQKWSKSVPKVAQKWANNGQKMAKKLPKSCQKVVKNLRQTVTKKIAQFHPLRGKNEEIGKYEQKRDSKKCPPKMFKIWPNTSKAGQKLAKSSPKPEKKPAKK